MTEPIFIFISYRSLDRAKVDAICSRLRGERNPDGTPRYRIWQDKHDIIEGHDWWQSIMDAIEQCDVFLFMVSQEAVRSEVCKTEIRHASACNRPILPLILPDEFQYRGTDRFIPYHAEMPSEIIGRKAHYLFHEGEGYVAQVNRSVDGYMAEAKTRWRFTKPLYRPLDPNATTAASNDVIAIYDEACDYAYRTEFDRAVTLFQRVIQLNHRRLADAAHGWTALLSDYNELVSLYVRKNTRHHAEDEWPSYVASFPRPFLKTVFDPKRIGAQIEGEDEGGGTSSQTPPHTGEGVKPQGQTPVAQPQKSATQPPLEQKPTPPAQQTPPLPTERGLGGEVAPKPDPVQEALTRAREFHKTGTRNKDWTPFYVIFPDIKRKGFDEAKGKGLEMRFCVVPTGTFQMGSEDGHWSDELPVHPQTFNQPFYIAQTPVTNAQWKVAVAAKAVNEPEDPLEWYNDPAMANAPVVGVTWFECQKFATWAGCRLPTEREWEYAARGIESLRYPWGNDWDENKAVWSGNSGGQPNDVSSKPDGVSWVGTLHQSGNVWEWCASLYDSYPYPTDGSRERDTGNSTDVRRVLRGGSWYYTNTSGLRGANRNRYNPNNTNDDRGFRLARPS